MILYVLTLKNGGYYVGVTNSLARRFGEHWLGVGDGVSRP